jgi:hypothetical protein
MPSSPAGTKSSLPNRPMARRHLQALILRQAPQQINRAAYISTVTFWCCPLLHCTVRTDVGADSPLPLPLRDKPTCSRTYKYTLAGAHMYRLQLSPCRERVPGVQRRGKDGAEAMAKRARTGIGCRDRSFGPFDPSPTHQSLVW